MEMKIKALTDVGIRRDNNEDSFSIGYWINTEKLSFHLEGSKGGIPFKEGRMKLSVENGELMIRYGKKVRRYPSKINENILKDMSILTVCDGMGGHNAGEVASAFVAEYFPPAFMSFLIKDGDEIENTVKKAAKRLNHIKYDTIRYSHLKGMGTTMVSMIFDGKMAYFANIGDSRAYLFRDGYLKQITRDHSFVQALLDAGAITEEEAFDHPQKNIITNSMLTDEDVDVDVFELAPQEGDIFLLCTDGLHDMLRDREIEEIMKNTDFEDMPKALIDAALERGGKDNVTVVLAKVV